MFRCFPLYVLSTEAGATKDRTSLIAQTLFLVNPFPLRLALKMSNNVNTWIGEHKLGKQFCYYDYSTNYQYPVPAWCNDLIVQWQYWFWSYFLFLKVKITHICHYLKLSKTAEERLVKNPSSSSAIFNGLGVFWPTAAYKGGVFTGHQLITKWYGLWSGNLTLIQLGMLIWWELPTEITYGMGG